MSELTIAASGVRSLLEFAISKGASRRALIDRAQLSTIDLDDPDNRIPFSRYVALMHAGQELCSDPALALHFGESVDVAEFSFIPQIGAPSVTEAFAVMNRYARLTVEVDDGGADRYVLSRSGGQLWMMDTRKNANDFPELTESSFARIISQMRRFVGDTRLLKEVHVTHAAPSYRAEYNRIFAVPVVFNSDKNAFQIDEAAMRLKPPVVSAYASQVLTAHADDLLQKLESSKSTRARVERLLAPILKSGGVRMEAIASELGVSRQTLFRRLKSENVTFEKVLDELRHKMALHYLHGGKMSVSQTAHLVGFSDPAAFSRAFKRWTGSSPKMQRNHTSI